MISHLFVRHAESIVHRFNDGTYVVSRLKELSELYKAVSPDLAGTLIGISQNTSFTKCQAISIKVEQGVEAIKNGTKTSQLFNEIHDAILHSEHFSDKMIEPHFDVKEHLEDFNAAYDKYIDLQRADTACELMIQGHRSYASISTFRDTLQQISAAISNDQTDAGENEGVLTLFFPQAISFDSLVDKLSAIEAVYNDLVGLAGLSVADHPLRIAKIETGSLFIKVVGAIFPTKLLGEFTRKTAEILFRRFVKEGKIEAEGEYRKEIVEILDLRNSLNEIGVDTSKMDDRLSHAATKHAERLGKLMYGESAVEVDGVAVTIGAMQEAEFLEQRKLRLLEHRQEWVGRTETPLIEGPVEEDASDA